MGILYNLGRAMGQVAPRTGCRGFSDSADGDVAAARARDANMERPRTSRFGESLPKRRNAGTANLLGKGGEKALSPKMI